MQFEDDVLLPKYAVLQEPGKWDATFYQLEHHKIVDLYLKIEQEGDHSTEAMVRARELTLADELKVGGLSAACP